MSIGKHQLAFGGEYVRSQMNVYNLYEMNGYFTFTGDNSKEIFTFQLSPQAEDLAPDVELVNVSTGTRSRLHGLRGKVVCLEFWATWCGPCQSAMAKLSKLTEEQNPSWQDRVAIVPVSIDARPELVQSHVAQRGWDRLGEAGPPRRERTGQVWGRLTADYARACVHTRA